MCVMLGISRKIFFYQTSSILSKKNLLEVHKLNEAFGKFSAKLCAETKVNEIQMTSDVDSF